MKKLFKTADVIKFLYSFDCSITAEDIKSKSNGAEFVDSNFVRGFLIDEIYVALNETVNQYTYKTNTENYILQAAKNFHKDLMSTLGGSKPFGDSEMREKIVEPNLGSNYDAYIQFQGPEGQYNQAKQKYVKDMAGWKQLYRSSSDQGNAYLSPDGNVIKASILGGGGIIGAIYINNKL